MFDVTLGKAGWFPHCSTRSCQHTSALFYGALKEATWEADFVLAALTDNNRLEYGRQKVLIALYTDRNTNLVVKHSAVMVCQTPFNY